MKRKVKVKLEKAKRKAKRIVTELGSGAGHAIRN
tara:strand:- start:1083 stop:1184 length:102 start_codon:yes stop_codon:yes gene_type:complete